MQSAELGTYLVAGNGMTLYYFTKDSPGVSSANAGVIANWPVFYAASIVVPASLEAADFGSITRTDGAKQTTFMDYPLYYFVQDKAPGDTRGHGVNNVWFVVSPQAFMPPKAFPLVPGWYKDQQVQYYDFGANSAVSGDMVLTAPIYALIFGKNTDGSPNFVPGQHNIVNSVPGDPGYSDLWRVNLVTVPADYQADSIRSQADILAGGFAMEQTDILVNCPIVPPGSTTQTGIPLTQGWYKDRHIYYFDFGPNPAATAPIYALITGKDAQGNPQFVTGQHNIIDVVPGEEGYSDFWKVNLVTVPAGYVAETLKSAADVMATDYEMTATDIVVNCPVVGFPQTTNGGSGQTINLVAKNFAFDKSTITVSAGAQVTISFDNQDSAPHNFALYTNSAATDVIFKGTIITATQTAYTFQAPAAPGSYYFRCDVHPNMNGTFLVQ
jgi:predicted lipoprotein with Yx(FWY)xxD motif/plastocyanin